jgi:aryl-alcohol dehydrogenase-like predicted oxidoreductase
MSLRSTMLGTILWEISLQFPSYNVYRTRYWTGLVAEVRRLAAEKHVTAGQLALAWLLAQGEDVVPIPGTKRRVNRE